MSEKTSVFWTAISAMILLIVACGSIFVLFTPPPQTGWTYTVIHIDYMEGRVNETVTTGNMKLSWDDYCFFKFTGFRNATYTFWCCDMSECMGECVSSKNVTLTEDETYYMGYYIEPAKIYYLSIGFIGVIKISSEYTGDI